MDLLLRVGSASCSRCVAVFWRNQDVGFQRVEYLHASSAHRNRAQAAEINGGQFAKRFQVGNQF